MSHVTLDNLLPRISSIQHQLPLCETDIGQKQASPVCMVTPLGQFSSYDLESRAAMVTPTQQANVHLGRTFTSEYHISDASPLADGASLDILIKVGEETPHFIAGAYSEGLSQFYLYNGVTVSSDGTPVFVSNRNENSVSTTDVTIFHTPTISDLGAVHIDGRWMGSTGAGLTSFFDRAFDQRERILVANTNYLLRITARELNIRVSALMDWYRY